MGTDEQTAFNLQDTEVIDSVSSSVGFTAEYITAVKMETLIYVLIQPQGGPIMYETNGDAATTETGIYIADFGVVEIWGWQAIQNFKCIDKGGSAKLSCKYYGT